MNPLEALNRSLFLLINGTPDAPPWLVNTAIAIGEYGIYLIPALLLVLWFNGNTGTRKRAIRACAVAMLGVGLNQIIPFFWSHPRPFALNLGHTWISHAADSSFPSDHLTVIAGVGLSLLFDGTVRIGVTTLLAGLCVGWARIFLGIHFPLDMLGAVAVAGIAHGVVRPLWRQMGTTITGFAEQLHRRLLARPIAAGWIRP